MNDAVFKISDFVGGGYNDFWKFKGRYRVVKGSRRSKKSKTTALWYIANLSKEKYREANLLVVRKTYRTLKDSCFTELKWAIKRLGLENTWIPKESPLEIENIETGQKIYFRGLDDPLKVTSITVENGCLCWMWIEEAYEITSEDDFDTLTESMLGDLPKGLFKQITLTFNPWSDKTWIKKRFFDVSDPDILAMTTNYMCNEWLSPADLKEFERMKKQKPRRYKIAGLGEWGVTDGLVYENWTEQYFTLITKTEFLKLDEAEQKQKNYVFKDNLDSAFGLDYGYTNDPTAFFCGFLSLSENKLYVWDEMYKKGLSNRAIYEEIKDMGYVKERIIADSAEPKSNDELKGLGLTRISGAKKGKDSVMNGIQWIQDLKIIIHPRCVNFLMEISTYQWKKDKFDKKLNEPEDDNNHLMDAMRYALERFIQKNKWLY